MSEAEDKAPGASIENLSERRLRKLAEQNRELRQYVAEVMKRLRANERLFSRLFELESQVLKATDPEDLCFVLLRGLRTGFDLDFVRFWFDRSSFMGGRKLDALSGRDLVWVESGEIEKMGLNRKRVWLMQLGEGDAGGFDWLEPSEAHLGSVALLVLGDLERPFGVLGLGSVDRQRFAPDQSTDFLQHLAQVVGLSLENAVARERLARLAITDSLTGSHNRRFLQPHSHQPLSQWFGPETPVACLYLDIDDFKAINDRLGHAAGDDVLTGVARIVRGHVRAQDPLIRMGGDEFVLLLPGCSREKAEQIAGHIVRAVSGRPLAGEDPVSVSVGVAHTDGNHDMPVKTLIDRADEAMYVAKALGGNRFEAAEDDA
ncbi:MAG: DUF484 family protein [Mariprofundaceae bacterium]